MSTRTDTKCPETDGKGQVRWTPNVIPNRHALFKNTRLNHESQPSLSHSSASVKHDTDDDSLGLSEREVNDERRNACVSSTEFIGHRDKHPRPGKSRLRLMTPTCRLGGIRRRVILRNRTCSRRSDKKNCTRSAITNSSLKQNPFKYA